MRLNLPLKYVSPTLCQFVYNLKVVLVMFLTVYYCCYRLIQMVYFLLIFSNDWASTCQFTKESFWG